VSIKKICPGIRPDWYSQVDDQTRIATPASAVRSGADLLVIGRPILTADDIVAAVERTNDEIDSVLGP
jgi:orotidine-5'-phosphate decarboxylase